MVGRTFLLRSWRRDVDALWSFDGLLYWYLLVTGVLFIGHSSQTVLSVVDLLALSCRSALFFIVV